LASSKQEVRAQPNTRLPIVEIRIDSLNRRATRDTPKTGFPEKFLKEG